MVGELIAKQSNNPFPNKYRMANNEEIIFNRKRTDNTADSFIKWTGFTFNIITPIGYITVNGKKVLTEQ